MPCGEPLRYLRGSVRVNQIAQAFHFRSADLAVFEQAGHEQFGRTFEKPVQEMRDRALPGFVATDERLVRECPALFGVADVAFVFENAEGRNDGGIGQRGIHGEAFEHVCNGSGPFVPQDLHEPEFSVGEVWGFFLAMWTRMF